MALLWTEGFGLFAYTSKWFDYTTEYEGSDTYLDRVDLEPTGGRRGGPCGRVNGSTLDNDSNPYFIRYNVSGSEQTDWIIGFALKQTAFTTAGHTWMAFYSASAVDYQFALSVDADGTVHIRDGIAGTSLANSDANVFLDDDVWHYFELKFSIGSSASLTVKRDGVTVWTSASVDLQAGGSGGVSHFLMRSPGASGAYFLRWADWYILDFSGTSFNDFLGDIKIDTFLPEADGADTDYTPSTGTDHYACVDSNLEDVDTGDNILADTIGYKDSFTTTITGDLPTILAAEITCYDNNPDTGQATCRPYFKISSVDYPGDTHNRGASIERGRAVFEENPATSLAWTKTALNAAEFGFEFQAAS